MAEDRIVWAILAALPASSLEDEAKAFRLEVLGAGDKYLEPWEIAPGEKEYAALINRNPGTRHVHEGPLADRLSGKLSAPVYIVYVDAEFFGSEGIEVYEQGRYTRDLEGDPYEFAWSLGCPIGDQLELSGLAAAQAKPSVQTVVVIESVGAVEVARAIGFDSPPETASMRIQEGPAGAIVSSETIPDLTMITFKLSAAFPKRDVYKLSTGPTANRFLVWIIRGGENVGVFDYQATAPAGSPSLDSVKGQSTPAGIIEALGVPAQLLNL